MIEIKRISKYSEIISSKDYYDDLIEAKNGILPRYHGCKIIQIVANDDLTRAYFEIVPICNIEQYLEEQTIVFKSTPVEKVEPMKTKADKDLETALETVFTNDPKGKYTGCKLREIFDNGDFEMVDWYLKNLLNKFIRDRIELIANSGYGGYNE